jgi:hypothetical protein
MFISSHRIKSQEKKLVKRTALTIVSVLALCVFSIYVGLPLLAKTIVVLSSFRKDQTTNTPNNASILIPPILNPIAEATNSAKIKISGFTQSETTVVLTINESQEIKITPDKDGKFTSSTITLKEGENKIVALAKKDNQTSDNSTPLIIQYKKGEPKLELANVKDGDKITQDDSSFTITGYTDAENSVTINDRFVIVTGNGKFSFDTRLSNGENAYKIMVKDPAGNEITQDLKLNYQP